MLKYITVLYGLLLIAYYYLFKIYTIVPDYMVGESVEIYVLHFIVFVSMFLLIATTILLISLKVVIKNRILEVLKIISMFYIFQILSVILALISSWLFDYIQWSVLLFVHTIKICAFTGSLLFIVSILIVELVAWIVNQRKST